MLIFLEGPDGLGKSTLASSLSATMRCPVFKPVGTPLKGMPVEVSQAEDRGSIGLAVLVAREVDIIFDRCFPSEYAYARAFARPTFDERQVWELDRAVADVPHIAFRFAGMNFTQKELKERGVDDIEPGEWRRINEAYSSYVANSLMNWRPVHKATQEVQHDMATRAIADYKGRYML